MPEGGGTKTAPKRGRAVVPANAQSFDERAGSLFGAGGNNFATDLFIFGPKAHHHAEVS